MRFLWTWFRGGISGAALTVGLHGLFQPKHFCDSMAILCYSFVSHTGRDGVVDGAVGDSVVPWVQRRLLSWLGGLVTLSLR